MYEKAMLSTGIVDLSDKLPFEGWLLLRRILAMSNVIEMRRKTEGEERLTGGRGERGGGKKRCQEGRLMWK